MSNITTLSSNLTMLKEPLSIKVLLQDFFRTSAFQITAEIVTVLSLFAGILIWALVAPTL